MRVRPQEAAVGINIGNIVTGLDIFYKIHGSVIDGPIATSWFINGSFDIQCQLNTHATYTRSLRLP